MFEKMLVKWFLLMTVVSLTLACSGADKPDGQTPVPDLDQTSWVLSSIETPTGEQFLGVDLRVVTLAFQDGSVSGSAGCNSFGSTYATSGSELSISEQMVQTLMACADTLMNLESAVTKGLIGVESYNIEQGQLILSGAGYRLVYDTQS